MNIFHVRHYKQKSITEVIYMKKWI